MEKAYYFFCMAGLVAFALAFLNWRWNREDARFDASIDTELDRMEMQKKLLFNQHIKQANEALNALIWFNKKQVYAEDCFKLNFTAVRYLVDESVTSDAIREALRMRKRELSKYNQARDLIVDWGHVTASIKDEIYNSVPASVREAEKVKPLMIGIDPRNLKHEHN